MLNKVAAGKETLNTHLIHRGIEAVQSAKHFPFVTTQEVICQIFFPEWNSNLMDGLVPLDESVNQMEHLWLCTPSRFSRFIGNTFSWEIVQEAEKLQIRVEDEIQGFQKNGQCILWMSGRNRILYPLYRKLFGILNRVR